MVEELLDSQELGFFGTTIVFLIVGLIGNVFVIRIVHKTRDMHTPTNYLLANMAVSDVMSISLWPLNFFEFGKIACKFLALTEISITVSSVTLTVLAVERYHAILKPFRTGLRLREENSKLAIACIWITSVIICFPELIFKDWNETYSTCIGPWTLVMTEASKVYVMINISVTFVQMAVMFYCYGSLIRGLYFTNTVCSETVGERSEKKKLVITLLLATSGFFIGYAPTVSCYTFFATRDVNDIDSSLFYALSNVADCIFAVSLCCNPILYAFRSKKFREGFKRIIICQKRTSQNEIQLQ